MSQTGAFWIASDHFRNIKQLSLGGAVGAPFQGLGFAGQHIFYYKTAGIWRSDTAGSPPVRITPSEISAGFMSLSPDGGRIAFEVLRNSKVNIWLADADGGNLRQLTDGTRDQRPVFSPDGNEVLFSRVEKESGYLYRISVSGGQPTRISNLPLGFASSTRPGGDVLCQYFDTKAGRGRIAIVSLQDGHLVRALDFPSWASQPLFTPDGRGISYVDDHDGASNIWYMPLQGGPSRKLTKFASEEEIKAYVWSLDGTWVLLTRNIDGGDVVLIQNFRRPAQR